MTERPILFSGEMVRAILDGRKTQTRRVIKFADVPHEPDSHNVWRCFNGKPEKWSYQFQDGDFVIRNPYGQRGDRLWVRETWGIGYSQGYRIDPCLAYRTAHTTADQYPIDPKVIPIGFKHRDGWRPSIHMPRWASRITLELSDFVRAQRLQEINDDDIIAEGTQRAKVVRAGKVSDCWRWSFAQLWDSINAKRGYGWDSNPWVWAIKFRRISA